MAESKFIDPRFYCCSSPIRSNQSDWHIQCFIQMLTKEEGHSAEIFVSFRRTNFPLSLNTFYEKVKVYTMGKYSKEICGGPHAGHTGELGTFKIKKEEASSAGVRRIKAVLQ